LLRQDNQRDLFGFCQKTVILEELGMNDRQIVGAIGTSHIDGISEATYRRTVEKLLYGIGQGSCSSPILWAVLNQLTMTALGEQFECIQLVSVDNSKTNTRPGDSFVDDATTGVTSDDKAREPVPLEETDLATNEVELIYKMQVIIQFFLDLLQVIGGGLLQRNACATLSHTGGKNMYLDY
jgi:hypothetical protein